MFVITDEKDVIIHISKTIGYQDNGNVLVDDDTLAIAKPLFKNIYENIEVPNDVTEAKFCYTKEKGFYKNPDYTEYFSEEDRISALEDAVNMLLGF